MQKTTPFRYRGYVYDEETGFYYLNSRYYDPETGRFINADGYVSTGQGILGYNMFAYCLNNPVNMSDSCGYRAIWLTGLAAENIGKTNSMKEEDSNVEVFNHVTMEHIYTPLLMLEDSLCGKIGFSTTTTISDKECGIFYSYCDIGNDVDRYGLGVNAVDFLGADVGVDTGCDLYANVQITPWVHGGVSVGLEGLGIIIGVEYLNTSYDFEIYGRWELAMILLYPYLVANGVCVPVTNP